MCKFLWLRPLAHRCLDRHGRSAGAGRSAVAARQRVRPWLEVLEDRITPATFTPTVFTDGINDVGPVKTLRDAINHANNDTGTSADTIQLSAGAYTLTLANAPNHDIHNLAGDLNITNTSHALVIQGATDASGKPTTTIQQTTGDRVFQIVNAGASVTFENLIIEGGYAQDDGGAGIVARSGDTKGGGILDDGGNVTLSNVVLQSNQAMAGSSSATSFAAYGGGIYVEKGSLTINSSVIQLNSTAGSDVGTSVDGGSAEGGGVYVSGTTTITDSILSNNTLYGGGYPGGPASSRDGGAAMGGGIFALGTASITDSILSDNTVDGGSSQGGRSGWAYGGGVFTSGTTTITGSTLTSNTLYGGDNASGSFGGFAIGGGVSAAGTITIADSDLSGNALHGGYGGGGVWGGGVYNIQGTTTITHSTLSGNNLIGGQGDINTPINYGGDGGGEARGGGVFVAGSSKLVISASTLSNNTLTGGAGSLNNNAAILGGDIGGDAQGGGVYNASQNTVTINTSILSGNKLTGGAGEHISGTVKGNWNGSAQGGGVYVDPAVTAPLTITASTLSDNTLNGGFSSGLVEPGLAQGGGAYLGGVGNQIVNSTIVDNQATGDSEGGGLYFASAATATLINDTVAGNKASPDISIGDSTGGGIDNTNTAAQAVTLINTLVAVNNAVFGPDYNGVVSSSSGHNLIGNSDKSSGFSAAHGGLLGSTTNPLNPLLGPLQNNGGLTPTAALLPGSSAIDAGDNSAAGLPATDQRSLARITGAAVDIGAFEVQQPPPTLTPPPPPPPGGGGSSPSLAPPPALHTPPLLAFYDSLLGGIETSNGNNTETVVDSFFGIPLFISIYDGAGNLRSVTLFGIDVTFLFEML